MTPEFAQLWGAGMTTAGNFAGSVVSNIANRQLAAEQHRRNLQMWNLQNDYNHPSRQIERLKEAGLNPDLIYQNNPYSAGNSTAPPQQAPIPTIQAFSQNPLLWSEVSKNVAEAKEKRENAKKTHYQALTEEQNYEYRKLERYILEQTQWDVINGIKNENAKKSIDFYVSQSNFDRSQVDNLVNWSKMGIPFEVVVDKNSGFMTVIPHSEQIMNKSFMQGDVWKAFMKDVENQYKLSGKQLDELQANIDYMTTKANVEETRALADNLLTMVRVTAEAMHEGIKLKWHDDGTVSIVPPDSGTYSKQVLNEFTRLITGILRIGVKK